MPKTSDISHPVSSRKFLGFSLSILLIALAVAGITAWLFFTKVLPATDPVIKLKTALEKITQQQVTQEGHTLEIRTQDIQELSVVEREMQSIIKYETTFLGSKKTIILKGKFKAKAGFDLTKAGKFSIVNGKVSGEPPAAEILSVELLDYEVYHSQDGTLNKLQPPDQEAATKQLFYQARKDAEGSNLKQRAESQFKQRLDDLMGSPPPIL